MIAPSLPATIHDLDGTRWESFQPYYEELLAREVGPENRRQWLEDWSHLNRVVREVFAVTANAKNMDTSDPAREQAFLNFINHVLPAHQVVDQQLKQKLLAQDVTDEDLALVLRDLRNQAELFREENVALDTRLRALGNEYDKVTGAMTVDWEGETKNLSQLTPFLAGTDREVRRRAWEAMMGRWLQDRERLNQIFAQMLALRQKVAANAGLPDYRAYAFRARGRFDYTPEDCFTFHQAIEAVAVPASQRIMARKRARAGYADLRPWDWVPDLGMSFDASSAPPLHPYQSEEELIATARTIFHQVDPTLGAYFATMADEGLLDLQTRPGKALGGYCMTLALRRRPFIFMNGVGLHDNVQTLLHEAGHAFHVFERADLPLIWQWQSPMEFNEVASMAMELLAAPCLSRDQGGFYTPAEAARARIEHLEKVILFWPYMAVVDAFQHWVYTHPDEAMEPAACDATWDALWQRFLPGVNWAGNEATRMTGWHRKPHIFDAPFYYIEYGMAQVGALQVWGNSLAEPAGALAAYRRALSYGGTKTLPALFEAAGAQFRFDVPMLTGLVALVENTIEQLEAQQDS